MGADKKIKLNTEYKKLFTGWTDAQFGRGGESPAGARG